MACAAQRERHAKKQGENEDHVQTRSESKIG